MERSLNSDLKEFSIDEYAKSNAKKVEKKEVKKKK